MSAGYKFRPTDDPAEHVAQAEQLLVWADEAEEQGKSPCELSMHVGSHYCHAARGEVEAGNLAAAARLFRLARAPWLRAGHGHPAECAIDAARLLEGEPVTRHELARADNALFPLISPTSSGAPRLRAARAELREKLDRADVNVHRPRSYPLPDWYLLGQRRPG